MDAKTEEMVRKRIREIIEELLDERGIPRQDKAPNDPKGAAREATNSVYLDERERRLRFLFVTTRLRLRQEGAQ